MRIASLLPSATEVVYALGLGDALVGRSPECDYPPAVTAKPVVSASVFDGTSMGSAEIDATVRRHLESPAGAGSLYHIDLARLRAVKPDLILTQALCDVCAATVDEVQAAAQGLDPAPEVLTLSPSSLDDILEDILVIGERTGRRDRAKALVNELRTRLETVRARVADAGKPRVVCLEWLEPIFNAGHWVPQQVEYAGGREVLGSAGKPSRTVPWDRVIAANPEVLVLMPCGLDMGRAERETSLVTDRDGFADLPAVRDGNVFLVNGSAYFNRPGPRTVDGVELLAHLLHPEISPKAWPDDAARRLT